MLLRFGWSESSEWWQWLQWGVGRKRRYKVQMFGKKYQKNPNLQMPNPNSSKSYWPFQPLNTLCWPSWVLTNWTSLETKFKLQILKSKSFLKGPGSIGSKCNRSIWTGQSARVGSEDRGIKDGQWDPSRGAVERRANPFPPSSNPSLGRTFGRVSHPFGPKHPFFCRFKAFARLEFENQWPSLNKR